MASISFRFALMMIGDMALWHKAGMSAILGLSVSRSTLVALARMGVVFKVVGDGGLEGIFSGLTKLAVFLRRVMHLICLVFDFVIPRQSLVFFFVMGG